jgi:hypothetical protein
MPTINDDVFNEDDDEDATISFRGARALGLLLQNSAKAMIHHGHLVASIMRRVAIQTASAAVSRSLRAGRSVPTHPHIDPGIRARPHARPFAAASDPPHVTAAVWRIRPRR